MSVSKRFASPRRQAEKIRYDALAMVASANESVPTERKVSPNTALIVVSRSLSRTKHHTFPMRRHLAIKELSSFLALAHRNKDAAPVYVHTDLLPIGHPASKRHHAMTASAVMREQARWIFAGIDADEDIKSLVASALISGNPVEYEYVTTRLSAMENGGSVLKALLAAIGDGNSWLARSLRARKQRRDKDGQFAFQGGGFSLSIEMPDGSIRRLTGRTVSENGNTEGTDIEIETPDGKIYQVEASKGQYVMAILDSTPDGYSPTPAIHKSGDPLTKQADLKTVEMPSGFRRDDSYTGPGTKYTDDAYVVIKHDGPSRETRDIIDRANDAAARRNIAAPAIKRDGNAWDPDKPLFEIYRESGSAKGRGFAQNWADAQDLIQADEPLMDEDEKGIGGGESSQPVATIPTEATEDAYVYPTNAYKMPLNVEYAPKGSDDPNVSPDYTDDPVALAQKFNEQQLTNALSDAVLGSEDTAATGQGSLPFSEGDESLPAEAIYQAIDELGDARETLARIYDAGLGDGSTTNLDAYRASKGDITDGSDVADEVVDRQEDGSKKPTPVVNKSDEEDEFPLPALLEGLSEEELAQFNETGDWRPFLPKNEDFDVPEGYTTLGEDAYPESEISEIETEEQAEETGLPLGFSDSPLWLAQTMSDEDLISNIRESVEPDSEMPGSARLTVDTDEGEVDVYVDGAAFRDAAQLKGIDTNELLRGIYAEGLEGQDGEISDEEIANMEQDEDTEDSSSLPPNIEPKPLPGPGIDFDNHVMFTSPQFDWEWSPATGWVLSRLGKQKVENYKKMLDSLGLGTDEKDSKTNNLPDESSASPLGTEPNDIFDDPRIYAPSQSPVNNIPANELVDGDLIDASVFGEDNLSGIWSVSDVDFIESEDEDGQQVTGVATLTRGDNSVKVTFSPAETFSVHGNIYDRVKSLQEAIANGSATPSGQSDREEENKRATYSDPTKPVDFPTIEKVATSSQGKQESEQEFVPPVTTPETDAPLTAEQVLKNLLEALRPNKNNKNHVRVLPRPADRSQRRQTGGNPHIVEDTAADLLVGDVLTKDHFVIERIDELGDGRIQLIGHYPGHQTQRGPIVGRNSKVRVIRFAEPPAKGEGKGLVPPNPDNYPGGARDRQYRYDLAVYNKSMQEVKRQWTPPENLEEFAWVQDPKVVDGFWYQFALYYGKPYGFTKEDWLRGVAKRLKKVRDPLISPTLVDDIVTPKPLTPEDAQDSTPKEKETLPKDVRKSFIEDFIAAHRGTRRGFPNPSTLTKKENEILDYYIKASKAQRETMVSLYERYEWSEYKEEEAIPFDSDRVQVDVDGVESTLKAQEIQRVLNALEERPEVTDELGAGELSPGNDWVFITYVDPWGLQQTQWVPTYQGREKAMIALGKEKPTELGVPGTTNGVWVAGEDGSWSVGPAADKELSEIINSPRFRRSDTGEDMTNSMEDSSEKIVIKIPPTREALVEMAEILWDSAETGEPMPEDFPDQVAASLNYNFSAGDLLSPDSSKGTVTPENLEDIPTEEEIRDAQLESVPAVKLTGDQQRNIKDALTKSSVIQGGDVNISRPYQNPLFRDLGELEVRNTEGQLVATILPNGDVDWENKESYDTYSPDLEDIISSYSEKESSTPTTTPTTAPQTTTTTPDIIEGESVVRSSVSGPNGEEYEAMTSLLPRISGNPERYETNIYDAKTGTLLSSELSSSREEAEKHHNDLLNGLQNGTVQFVPVDYQVNPNINDPKETDASPYEDVPGNPSLPKERLRRIGDPVVRQWQEDYFIYGDMNHQARIGDRVQHYYDDDDFLGEGVVVGFQAIHNPGDKERIAYAVVAFPNGQYRLWATRMLFLNRRSPGFDNDSSTVPSNTPEGAIPQIPGGGPEDVDKRGRPIKRDERGIRKDQRRFFGRRNRDILWKLAGGKWRLEIDPNIKKRKDRIAKINLERAKRNLPPIKDDQAALPIQAELRSAEFEELAIRYMDAEALDSLRQNSSPTNAKYVRDYDGNNQHAIIYDYQPEDTNSRFRLVMTVPTGRGRDTNFTGFIQSLDREGAEIERFDIQTRDNPERVMEDLMNRMRELTPVRRGESDPSSPNFIPGQDRPTPSVIRPDNTIPQSGPQRRNTVVRNTPPPPPPGSTPNAPQEPTSDVTPEGANPEAEMNQFVEEFRSSPAVLDNNLKVSRSFELGKSEISVESGELEVVIGRDQQLERWYVTGEGRSTSYFSKIKDAGAEAAYLLQFDPRPVRPSGTPQDAPANSTPVAARFLDVESVPAGGSPDGRVFNVDYSAVQPDRFGVKNADGNPVTAQQFIDQGWKKNKAEGIALAGNTRPSLERIFGMIADWQFASMNDAQDLDNKIKEEIRLAFGENIKIAGGYRLDNFSVYFDDDGDKNFSVEFDILDKDGVYAGRGQRNVDGDMGRVYNSSLFITPSNQKNGIASAFNEYMENWYIANGLKYVDVEASAADSNTGALVWALNGFNWQSLMGGIAQIDKFVFELERSGSPEDKRQLDLIKKKAEKALNRDWVDIEGNFFPRATEIPEGFPTPMELALIGWTMDGSLGEDSSWIGADIMELKTWLGRKHLTPDNIELKQKQAYDQMKKARRMVESGQNTVTSSPITLSLTDKETYKDGLGAELAPYADELSAWALSDDKSVSRLSPPAKIALNRYVSELTTSGDYPEESAESLTEISAALHSDRIALDPEAANKVVLNQAFFEGGVDTPPASEAKLSPQEWKDKKIEEIKDLLITSILADLENGVLPWQKGWTGRGTFFPTNISTGNQYSGINLFILMYAQQANGFSTNRWMGAKQGEGMGGTLKEGAKPTDILVYKPGKKIVKKDKATGEEKEFYTRGVSKFVQVYNVDQFDGLNLPEEPEIQPIPMSEAEGEILRRYADHPPIEFIDMPTGDSPHYIPSDDKIVMPKREQYGDDQARFIETLLHELAHSTGHKSRLDRSELFDQLGVEDMAGHQTSRATEELIAQMSAAMMAAKLGVEIDVANTSAYVKSWLSALQNDKDMIFKAAGFASNVVDYVFKEREDKDRLGGYGQSGDDSSADAPETTESDEPNLGKSGKSGEEIAEDKEQSSSKKVSNQSEALERIWRGVITNTSDGLGAEVEQDIQDKLDEPDGEWTASQAISFWADNIETRNAVKADIAKNLEKYTWTVPVEQLMEAADIGAGLKNDYLSYIRDVQEDEDGENLLGIRVVELGGGGHLNDFDYSDFIDTQGLTSGTVTVAEVQRRLDKMKAEGKMLYPLAVVGSDEAESLVRQAVLSRLIAQWAQTSNNNNAYSLAIQQTAKQEFDLSDASEWESPEQLRNYLEETSAQLSEENYDVYSQFLRGQYEETQKFFKEKGIDTLTLYRGSGTGAYSDTEVTTRPLSSWSTDFFTAQKFASANEGGLIYKTEVRVSRVLSTSGTGFGALPEYEVVLLGGRLPVSTINEQDAFGPDDFPEDQVNAEIDKLFEKDSSADEVGSGVGSEGKTGEEIAAERKVGGSGLTAKETFDLKQLTDSQRAKVYKAENKFQSYEGRPSYDRTKYSSYDQYLEDFYSWREEVYIPKSTLGEEKLDGSISGVSDYVNSLINSDWFVEKFGDGSLVGQPKIRKSSAKKYGAAYIQGVKRGISISEIAVTRGNYRNEELLIHEIAHYATTISLAKSHAGHGKEFVSNYLEIAKNVIGLEYARKLAEQFRNDGVSFEFE